jgi:hypothetical protein
VVCGACHRVIGFGVSCDPFGGWQQPDGTLLPRVPVTERCHDCGVQPGYHHAACSQEPCPHEVADPTLVCDSCVLVTS